MVLPIQLRPIEAADDFFLRELEAQPDVRERIGGLNPHKFKKGIFRIATINESPVAVVALVPYGTTAANNLQLVCATATQFQCKGIATAASRALLLEHNLSPQAHRVFACVAPDNAAGMQVASRLGFHRLSAPSDKGEIVFELGSDDHASIAALSNDR